MIKKIVLILFVMLFSVCFAAQSKQAEYKHEIEAYAAKEAPEIIERIDTNFMLARRLHDRYPYVNKDKYADQLYDYMNNINTEEMYFFLDLIDITDKYIPVKEKMPPTDSAADLYSFIFPYLKAAKINLKYINAVSNESTKAIKIFYFIEEIP